MPVIARTGAMLVIGHKAPMETSAIACRSESLNQRRKADRLKQVSGPQRCRPTPSRLVTRQHRKHYRSQNVLFRWSIGALVLQGAVPHPTLPPPVRLQKFDEVSSRPEAGHVRFRIPANEYLPPECVNGARSFLRQHFLASLTCLVNGYQS